MSESIPELTAAELNIASIIVRVMQIDREDTPTHWLWDRIITCDIPRLRAMLPDDVSRYIAGYLV